MSKQSWRDLAINRIASCLLEYEASCACLDKLLDPVEARKYCNDRYPFTMRKYTPYQIWLQELKLVKVFVESRQPARNYSAWRARITSTGLKKGATAETAEGQLSLI